MRKIVTASALSIFVVCTGLAACDKSKAPNETNADNERDLSLASSVQRQRTGIVSPIEQVSNGAPSGNSAGKRLGVETKKRAPSPAPSPKAEDVAAAPADAKPLPAPTATATEVAPAEASPTPAPAEAPVMMVTDHVNGAAYANGSSDGSGAGVNGVTDRGRFGAGDRGSFPQGAIIRGGQTGVDHCEPGGGRGGNGIIGGQTFGSTGGAHAPPGSTSGGTGARGPENGNLPPGLGTLGGSGGVSAGVARGPRR